MTGHEIRQSFLDFFAQRGHRVVRSSPLVPHADPTLLFTNAGMNQFKDVFLGLEPRDYTRAASTQKCLRAGGKHNDLENVGRTLRHHTFFEMLGNFSFGDYFKREAIAYAWELLTAVWKLPKDKLYITVFGGEEREVAPGQVLDSDQESKVHWANQGVSVSFSGVEDNFWAMGDTGPCGPCSEIFYDFGPAASELGHKDCTFPCDCGRFVELWNLVFMQFNRDASGKMTPLPKPCVDTGAGLERLAAALQSKVSNYDTDLFRPLLARAAEMAGTGYGTDARTDMALRIIVDHSRAAAFLVADGVLPSNEGRGYVLRKILRRAIDNGRLLGLKKPFLFEMSGQVAELMREPYPEVLESIQRVATVIKTEEHKYSRLLVPAIASVRKYMEARGWKPKGPREQEFSLEKAQVGELLFYAYSTLGLRPDFMQDWLQAQRYKIPRDFNEAFEDRLEEERERAKASWKGVGKEVASPAYQQLAARARPEFVGYTKTEAEDCRIEGIVTRAGSANELPEGEEGEVVLDRTPFYAEAGGQVGDTGVFYAPGGEEEVARVRTTYYPLAGLIAHKVKAQERLRVGDRVAVVVDREAREATMRNHTGTHLLHAALRAVLGPHVKQSGSLVAPDRLRFDFSHYAALDPEELAEIERLANEHILRDTPVTEERMDLDAALKSGALAFFGDKYPEKNVRVIAIGEFSKELCGGTHVRHTGQIGLLKLVSESSIAAGIRRVEAITGGTALAQYQQALERLQRAAALLKTTESEVVESIERLLAQARASERQLEEIRRRVAQTQVDDLVQRVRRVKDVPVLAARLEDVDRATLRALADSLRQKLGSAVIVLGTTTNGKVVLIAAVTKDLTRKLHAGKIAQAVAGRLGGSGGGRADLAEAGGKDVEKLGLALAEVFAIVEKML